jgi:GDP-4-dehydro-6-deoxy-D-mannose reductase
VTTRPTLITGATGFAGSHLLEHFAGRTAIVAWHRPGGAPAHTMPGVTWQAVDVVDRESVRRSIYDAQPSQIFHLAGAARVDTSWDNIVPHLEANVLGTSNLLDAVRTAGTDCRVLVVTSALVYGTANGLIDEESPLCPSNPYGVSKLAQDLLARRSATADGMDVVIARPFNHIGPRQSPSFAVSSFARQIALVEAGRAAPEIHVGNLSAQRDLTDVRDVIDAYERLMRAGKAGRPYNVCSGQPVRMGDVLDLLLEHAHLPIRLIVDPARLRPNDIPVFAGNAGRIRSEVGWAPRHAIADTLLDTLNWWREQARAFA